MLGIGSGIFSSRSDASDAERSGGSRKNRTRRPARRMGGEGWAEFGFGAVLPYRALHARLAHCCRRKRDRDHDVDCTFETWEEECECPVCWDDDEPRYCGDFDLALALLARRTAPEAELRWTTRRAWDVAGTACYVAFAWRREWHGPMQDGDAHHATLTLAELRTMMQPAMQEAWRERTDPLLDALGYATDAPERELRFVAISGRAG